MSELGEPILHTFVTDCLPDDHPLAWESVECQQCAQLVHAFNNETMNAWVETGRGNYCVPCFHVAYSENYEDSFGLPTRGRP